jgi:hypothetical protein
MRDFADLQKTAEALQPITLPGDRSFAALYAGGFSALILLGLLTLPFNPFLTFGAVVAILAMAVMAVVTVVPGATYLAVDSRGFTRCLLFRKASFRWNEVTEIRTECFGSATFPIAWNRQVCVQSNDHAAEAGLSFFPYQFGLDAEQAVSLLTPYLENAQRPPVRHREAVAA